MGKNELQNYLGYTGSGSFLPINLLLITDYFLKMNKCYLLLGSNLGNSRDQLEEACQHISKRAGDIKKHSSLYQTAAWGKTDQPDFINQVIFVHTMMDAAKLMESILLIEEEMGRHRTERNAPRNIDIDILFFNDSIIDQPHLHIPHPRLPERRFVLVPMNELAPALIHPVLHKSIHQLLRVCTDPLAVKKIAG
jgi:2-amino-4-hydroxy-6-hydroxymethyldihydropteridine diphosphokinase